MREMSKKVLTEAFCGESMAHMKYLAFSEVAEREGFKNISRLFKAISYAEQVHAINHARAIKYIGDTEANLQAGIEGETYEIEEMYPAFDAIVKLQKEEAAYKPIYYAFEAEKIHRKLYKEALKKIKEKKDIELDDIYICPVCGYTHAGTLPSSCPICNIPGEKFKKF